jgi:NADH dehydrogenase [ubiquinone] 1 alpha subcomplex assembly factor 1
VHESVGRRTGFTIPVLLSVLAAVVALMASPLQSPAATTAVRLFEFSPPELTWEIVNDAVMGGVSTSRFTRVRGVGTFSGQVRLENNGGFASVRSRDFLPAIPSDANAFALRIRGDGRRYQFTVDTDLGWFWFAQATKKGQWITAIVPFNRLQPVSNFGEPVDRKAIQATTHNIDTVGLLIANKRAEQFSIQVDWIEVR